MKWWKIPPQDAPLADEGTIQAWRRKRRAIYQCIFAGFALATAGLLLQHRLLVAAVFVPAIAAKFLNTSCQTCPHCGYISVPAQNIHRGFTCQRCGYTIPDLRWPVSISLHNFRGGTANGFHEGVRKVVGKPRPVR